MLKKLFSFNFFVHSYTDEVFVKFEMGMSYNPLTKAWCWTNDKSVNYAMYAQKLKLTHSET